MRFDRIYVEIGNVCNLSCSFCPPHGREKKFMSIEQFQAVCGRICGYTKYVYLHVMGEPLIHPELDGILSTVAEYGLKACITTNGTCLCDKADLLLKYSDAIHRVSISLHAIEGNEQAGKSISAEGYISSAISFARAAAEKEINVAFRLWNLDTDERLGANSRNEEIVKRLRTAFSEPWQERFSGYRIGYRVFLEYDGIFTWPSESDGSSRHEGYCHALSRQIAILADGTVVPCCLDSEGKIPLGNIFESELSEILAAPRAKNMKDGFERRELREQLCKSCTYAKRFDK